MKLAKRKSSRPASSTPTVLTRCVMVYRPGKKKSGKPPVSYSDIQTLPDLSCYVTLPGPYPAVKLALKYKPRPKITEGFIPRRLDTRVDARLSALLEEREAEGSLARALFTPDAPASGPADTDSHAGEQPEPVSQPAPADMTVSPAPVKAPPTTKMPAAEPSRQSNGAARPAGHDRTVDQTKSSRSGRCCLNSVLCRYPCSSCRRDRTGAGAAVRRAGAGHAAGRHERGRCD